MLYSFHSEKFSPCKKELQDFRAILYGYDAEMNAAGSDMAARDTVAENHKTDTELYEAMKKQIVR